MNQTNRRIIRDYGVTILAAVLIAFFIRSFVIEAYRIPSPAMKPTLVPGDVLFVLKWPFSVRKLNLSFQVPTPSLPKRGEVILFSDSNHPTGRGPDFIKRVIGLPGDEISIRRGQVILNRKSLRSRSVSALPNRPGPEERAQTEDRCESETLPGGQSYEICFNPSQPIEDFGPIKVPAESVFVLGDYRVSPKDHPSQGWGTVPLSSIQGKATWIWLSIEPSSKTAANHNLPQFRFNRMFRSIL